MEHITRATILLAVASLGFWSKLSVGSLESTWYRAHQLRFRLLTNPSDAYAALCDDGTDTKEEPQVCTVSIFRKTQDRGWASLCSLPFSRASRWYEIRLECKAPFGPIPPMTAKTRIWR